MKRAGAAIAIFLVACGAGCGASGDDGAGGDPGGLPGDPGDGSGPVTEVSGHITASTAWMDTIHVIGSVTIDAGATLTVMPGTTVDMTSGTGIIVQGALAIPGTKASKVTFRAATPGEFWLATSVRGTMTASYLVQTGGGIAISSTGKATLVDSQMSHTAGDFLVVSGGTLDMSYSAIGLPLTQRDTVHCDMHVTGAATITATHSNFSTALYGLQLFGGTNADFRYTNWFSNAVDVDTEATSPVTGNFSGSYFGDAVPNGAGLVTQNLSATRVADAGVR